MSVRLIIACGGTGGHLFPGIAVAEALIKKGGVPLLIISQKEIDALAMEGHSDLEYECLASIGMPKFYSPKMLKFLRSLFIAYKKSKKIIKDFQSLSTKYFISKITMRNYMVSIISYINR